MWNRSLLIKFDLDLILPLIISTVRVVLCVRVYEKSAVVTTVRSVYATRHRFIT